MGDGKFAQRTIAILQVGSSADFAWLEQFGFWVNWMSLAMSKRQPAPHFSCLFMPKTGAAITSNYHFFNFV